MRYSLRGAVDHHQPRGIAGFDGALGDEVGGQVVVKVGGLHGGRILRVQQLGYGFGFHGVAQLHVNLVAAG